ncbi:Dihydrodipicolinate synthetase [Balamuthia mandrillaris]
MSSGSRSSSGGGGGGKERKRFKGRYVATLTPFKEGKNGALALNLDVLDQYAASLVADGVEGLFVNGTSGESMSLTVEERMRSLERWAELAKKYNLSLVAHITAQSLEDSKMLAAHAQAQGVDGIAAMPPSFFKPPTLAHLIDYLAQVGAAASHTPLLYYYFPRLTGVNYRLCDIFRAGKEVIPTLVGAKFTGEDLGDCILALAEGDFDVLLGNEMMVLPAMHIGVQGSVALAYSVFCPMFVKLQKAFEEGRYEDAKQEQLLCARMFSEVSAQGNLPSAFKALLKQLKGLDFGPMRCPNHTYTEEETQALVQRLAALGLDTSSAAH